jgi:hypothetical protein
MNQIQKRLAYCGPFWFQGPVCKRTANLRFKLTTDWDAWCDFQERLT